MIFIDLYHSSFKGGLVASEAASEDQPQTLAITKVTNQTSPIRCDPTGPNRMQRKRVVVNMFCSFASG